MFRWLRQNNWQNSKAHLLLLSKFIGGQHLKAFKGADYWDEALQELAHKAIKRFIDIRMLEPAGLVERMNCQFAVTQLKEMLKTRQLKISGAKSALIDRLITNDKNGMVALVKDLELYQCSLKGEQHANEYLASEKEKRINTEKSVNDFLQKMRLHDAAKAVAIFEAEQVFPRGLNVDWSRSIENPDTKLLETVFTAELGILKGIGLPKLESLRIAAANMLLWGTSKAKPYLPDNFETGINLDKEKAVNMMIINSYNVRRLNGYREVQAKHVVIRGGDSAYSCPACQRISNTKHDINNVPELPNPHCTSDEGCRCSFRLPEDFFK